MKLTPTIVWLLAAALACVACGEDKRSADAAVDAGLDAGVDGGDTDADTDTELDAAVDGGMDAGVDSGDTDTDTSSGDGTCEPAASLALDVVTVGNTTDEWNDLNGYACTALDESGPDVAYAYTNDAGHPLAVTALLYGIDQDLDLFWLRDDCAATSCVSHSATEASEHALIVLEPGQTGYVVVDGYLGAAGPYQLQLLGAPVETACADSIDDDGDALTDCDDADCADDPACAASCAASLSLACGVSTSGTTSGLDGGLDEYLGVPGALTGPELIYGFALDGGVEATATLSAAAEGLELLVLSPECATDSVIGVDPDSVAFAVEASTDYFVVVDGRDGGAGPFDLELACRETACADAVDNDGDGPTDCADPDCELSAPCVVTCTMLAEDGGCPLDAGPTVDGGVDAGDAAPQACYLLSSAPVTGFCHSAGTVDAGNPCAQPYDCRPGAVCTPADICLVACDLDDGIPDCDAGSCTSIGADPVGVCW
jgi:hypothetical protein